MGNRAVITMSKSANVQESSDIGIYLHWNGGRDSVNAFLTYCRLRGFRSDYYGMARLAQVIGNYFGGGLSIGMDQCCRLDCDNRDNGTYIIDNWKIVGRQYFNGTEQDGYDLIEMLCDIDKAQPETERLGSDFITAQEIPASELQIGDEVYVHVLDGAKTVLFRVLGFGTDEYHNGANVLGIPYVNMYPHFDERTGEKDFSWNINNYLWEKSYRVKHA